MLESKAYPAAAAVRASAASNPRLSASPYQRALIVANPIAGRGRGRRAAEELQAGLRSAGVPAELYLTQGRRDGWRHLRSAGAGLDLVVSVGGDGTLSEVLAGLVDPDVPVAQLPLGTANVLAKELHLPRDVDSALEVILAGHTTPLDSAEVNGRLSFLCTGSGIDGLAVAEVERRRQGPISKWSYVAALLGTLGRYRPPELRLSVDGQEIPDTFGFVLISNVREYGAFFHLSSRGRRDDGRVEAYGLRHAGLWGLTKMSLLASLKELPGQMVELFQGQSFRVEAPAEQPYQVDGDLGGRGSFEYRVSDRRFRILVPGPV
jgi:YegS/Rv2252/BmrU family lipid kinase